MECAPRNPRCGLGCAPHSVLAAPIREAPGCRFQYPAPLMYRSGLPQVKAYGNIWKLLISLYFNTAVTHCRPGDLYILPSRLHYWLSLRYNISPASRTGDMDVCCRSQGFRHWLSDRPQSIKPGAFARTCRNPANIHPLQLAIALTRSYMSGKIDKELPS